MFSPLPNSLHARGCDQLETLERLDRMCQLLISYSLGDAIDWKHPCPCFLSLEIILSYSLGDAIDWKLRNILNGVRCLCSGLLLARGRDRLKTTSLDKVAIALVISPTR